MIVTAWCSVMSSVPFGNYETIPSVTISFFPIFKYGGGDLLILKFWNIFDCQSWWPMEVQIDVKKQLKVEDYVVKYTVPKWRSFEQLLWCFNTGWLEKTKVDGILGFGIFHLEYVRKLCFQSFNDSNHIRKHFKILFDRPQNNDKLNYTRASLL